MIPKLNLIQMQSKKISQKIGSRIKTKVANTLIKGKEVTRNLAKETDDRIARFFDDKMNDKVDQLTEISAIYRWFYWAIYTLRLLRLLFVFTYSFEEIIWNYRCFILYYAW